MFELSFKGTQDEWNALFAGMLAHVRTPKPVEVAETPKLDAVQSRIAPELRRKPEEVTLRGEAGAKAQRSGDSAKLHKAKQKALELKTAFVTFKGSDVGAISAQEREAFNGWCANNDIQVADISPKWSTQPRWQYTPFIKDASGDVLYADGPRGKDSALRGAPARIEHKPYINKLDDVELVPRFNELQGIG